MTNTKSFHHLSYHSHAKQLDQYATGGAKESQGKTWLQTNTVDAWRHDRMYRLLDPILAECPGTRWLTLGDGRFGNDAHYIKSKGFAAVATDISDTLLKEAKELGYIDDYRQENAEALSFSDGQFDFVFCKESYHHFPRPMVALYEMLRVSSKGVILIEPNDRFMTSSFLELIFRHVTDLLITVTGKKVQKHSFEEVGNYFYPISQREIEKAAIGVSCKTLALSRLNDFYMEGVEYETVSEKGKIYGKIKCVIFLLDLLTKLKLRQHNLLVAAIFKQKLTGSLLNSLVKAGYRVLDLPENPYLNT